MPTRLGIKLDAKSKMVIPVNGRDLLIGRSVNADIILKNCCVSSRHCQISSSGTDVFVSDLNSRNGTFVNGQRVSRAMLKPGDQLRIAHIGLDLVELPDATNAVTAN